MAVTPRGFNLSHSAFTLCNKIITIFFAFFSPKLIKIALVIFKIKLLKIGNIFNKIDMPTKFFIHIPFTF